MCITTHSFGRLSAQVIVFALVCVGARRSEVLADETLGSNAWLEVPQLSVRIPGNGSTVLSEPASLVQQLVLHLPRTASRVDYGKVHAKVNTEAVDMAMSSVGLAEGMALHIDLTKGSGFPFKPGRNSVELEYEDRSTHAKYFNFVLDFTNTSSRGFELAPEAPGPAALPRRGPGKLFAVVIGISAYDDPAHSIQNLQYADADARAFGDFLRSPAGGSIAPENLLMLLNEEATAARVRSALYTFLTHPRPEDTVIIYIAAHGSPDPNDPRNLYLLTTDSRRGNMGGTAFPMWEIRDVFARILKAERVITFADTCHSYGFSGLRVGENADGNNLFNEYMEHYSSIRERAVITASDISEASSEDAKWGGGHGVFTWYLLRGLSGAADSNNDGAVTAGELFHYLRRSVSEATNRHQNPRAVAGLTASLIVSHPQKPLSEHAAEQSRPVLPTGGAL
jgi:hypothetical protein